MKVIKILGVIFFVIVFSVYGYIYLSFQSFVSATQSKCMAHNFSSEIINAQKKEFCDCTANYVSRNPFADNNRGQGKKDFDANTASCYNMISGEFAETECNSLNAASLNRGDPNQLDCSCYEKEFIKTFGFGSDESELNSEADVNNAQIKIIQACEIERDTSK